MAIDARRPRRAGGVVVMRCVVVGRRQVALGADGVAGRPQCEAMRFVAVAAGDARLVHLALHERAVDVHFFEDLAVDVVQAYFQQSGEVGVQQVGAMTILAQGCSPRMATRAGLDLPRFLGRRAAPRDGLVGDEMPCARISQVDIEAGIGCVLQPAAVGHCNVSLTRSVAGFAADVDLAPGGCVRVRVRVVSFRQVRAVTLGAAGVPVVVAAGPVQWIPRAALRICLAPFHDGRLRCR